MADKRYLKQKEACFFDRVIEKQKGEGKVYDTFGDEAYKTILEMTLPNASIGVSQ